jgi:radical SAM superfamily enzyme YgiQ (UPF0313 family)
MKKINVLMIYPKLPVTFWNTSYAFKFSTQKTIQPPLGLLTIAAMMPENYHIKLIDLNVGPLDIDDIKNSDLVFISAMVLHRESFDQLVKLCNLLKVPVVAGGPYPSVFYKEIKGVDHFVLNEAEITLPEFLRDYENGLPNKIYKTDVMADITMSPVPRFDLINVENYYLMPLQFTRGCPHNCEFCDIIEMFGRKPRTKTTEQFIRELDAVYQTGFKGELFIVDDNFVGNKNKTKELLRAIIAWQKEHDMPFELETQSGMELSKDDELLDLMAAANFCRVMIGFETPEISTLQFIGKKQNISSDPVESVKKIMRRGIMALGTFIVGFDTDDKKTFDRQIDFIQSSFIPVAGYGILKAVPGTRLYQRLEREKRIIDSENLTGSNEDLSINFVPKMNRDELFEGYKKIVNTIYSPANYFERCFNAMKLYPAGYKNKMHLRKGFLIPYLKSIILMTFSSYGYYYLRFLVRCALLNTELMRLASLMTLMGYHYFEAAKFLFADDYFEKAKKSVAMPEITGKKL